MMILHLPADGKKATLISLPRDTYVHIAGYGMNRLNSAYAYGYNNDTKGDLDDERRPPAPNLLISTVTNLTGLTINHYMQVSLLGLLRDQQRPRRRADRPVREPRRLARGQRRRPGCPAARASR